MKTARSWSQFYAQGCAACHVADGRGLPKLARAAGQRGSGAAGQPSFYAIAQLFLFRAGRRNKKAMSAAAKASLTATCAASRNSSASCRPCQPRRNRCASCHGSDFAGVTRVRLALTSGCYLFDSNLNS